MPLWPPYQQYEGKVPIQDDKTCEQVYRKKMHESNKTRIIFEDMLGAGTLGQGPCFVSHSGPAVTFQIASPFKGGWIWEFS